MAHQTTQPADPSGRSTQSVAMAHSLRMLRAVRHYADDALDEEMVHGWLESARWCGSSRNSQPWRFIVVDDPASRRELAGLGEHAHHLAEAPLVIVLAADPGPFPFSTVFDLGRVAQSLMLAAAADGVGSCIAVFEPPANMDRARSLLSIPDGIRVDLAIGFGRATTGDGPPSVPPPERPSPPGRRSLAEVAYRGVWGNPYDRS